MPLSDEERASLLADAASAAWREDCRLLRRLSASQPLSSAEYLAWAGAMSRLLPPSPHPPPPRPFIERRMLL